MTSEFFCVLTIFHIPISFAVNTGRVEKNRVSGTQMQSTLLNGMGSVSIHGLQRQQILEKNKFTFHYICFPYERRWYSKSTKKIIAFYTKITTVRYNWISWIFLFYVYAFGTNMQLSFFAKYQWHITRVRRGPTTLKLQYIY